MMFTLPWRPLNASFSPSFFLLVNFISFISFCSLETEKSDSYLTKLQQISKFMMNTLKTSPCSQGLPAIATSFQPYASAGVPGVMGVGG